MKIDRHTDTKMDRKTDRQMDGKTRWQRKMDRKIWSCIIVLLNVKASSSIFLKFLKKDEFSIIFCSCCTSRKDEKIWLNNATILKDFADLQAIQHNLYNRNFHSRLLNLINKVTVVTYGLTNSYILASLIC
jgi:hypothetical protein